MNTKAKRQVLARPGTVDDELIGAFNRIFIAVARQIPHHHLVARFDLLTCEFGIDQGGAAHMGQGRLPADDLGHQALHQRGVGTQFRKLRRVLMQRQQPTSHRTARGVIAADDQQAQIAHEFVGTHVARGRRVREH